MEKIMDVMATLLTAIFFEVLPVSLQKEIEKISRRILVTSVVS